ncbi:MAG: LPXTG cell wall anchor domain-containing protein [Erysipelotrichaceae bacterium]|nr:LPXTG cell wall anchor domain-containing protein [Erysipelotrichaceae bacterium]
MKKRILMILAAILLLNVFGNTIYAEEKEEKKTYTVTVSAGLHGMLEDENGNPIKQITVQIGADEEWMWNPNDYEIKDENIDENYYFMGYHIAGIEGALAGAQTITHDIVFVASYGIENNMVEYYVNYVDEDGKGIGPVRKTYQGNVGDKPVIAYIHIDGYAPLVENYTVTLKEDEVTELTFVYRKVKSNSGTIIIEEEAEGTGNGSVGTNQQSSSTETIEPEETEAPIELVDVDETNVPAAEPGEAQNSNESKNEDKKNGSFLQNYALPVIGGSLFLLLLLLLLLRRRRKEDE